MTAFIEDYGVYVPSGRVTSKTVSSLFGKGLPGFKTVSMPELDEDSLTMGFEAAKDSVAKINGKVDAIILATNSLPFEYKKGSSLLAKMLKIEKAWCLDLGASHLASAEALWLAAQLVDGGKMNRVLVIMSEHPMPQLGEEMDFGWGAGAAAFLVSSQGFAGLNFLDPDYDMEAYDVWKLRGDNKLRFRPETLDDNFKQAMGKFVNSLGGKEALKKYKFMAMSMNRSRWSKVIPGAGITPEQIDSVNCANYLGHVGTATLGINLALAFDQSVSGDTILGIGYAHGNIVSMEIKVDSAPNNLQLADSLQCGIEKNLADYWQAAYNRRLRS